MADTGAAVEYASSGVRLLARPRLFELLGAAGRVTVMSAPAGSGKTFLMHSWIAAEGLSNRVAWVSVGRDERDGQAFWVAVSDSLRRTGAGAERVRELTAAPDLDGATVVRRLLEDVGSLDERVWLVLDDLHELQDEQAIGQVELLLASAPPRLRFVLLTRHDLRLGLHRLRLEGQLTEIRGEKLRFSAEEARGLLEASGVRLSDGALGSLVARTEGWAAGLRLAVLSLAGDPDPERLAARFSGRERGVAEYLLAEVLEHQPKEVARLLLRTSILERVSGPLADRLTGATGSEQILWALENAGAFVVSLDPERTWFRYHHLFAQLLSLELRRTAPQDLPGLHATAAEWLAERGHPVEAIRHAQAAENWDLAARLLMDNCRVMYLDGRIATARELLSSFPADKVVANPELAVLAAGDNRLFGFLREAERYLALAERKSGLVPEQRRWGFHVGLAIVRLWLARDRNDPDAAAEEGQRLLDLADSPEAIQAEFAEQRLRATALIELGVAELFAGRLEAAERHLEDALKEAREIGQPWLELQALSNSALVSVTRSEAIADQRAREAIELARAHGWEETATSAATAEVVLGTGAVWRGQLAEAERWLDSAELVLQRFAEPTTAMMLYAARAMLELARGRLEDAMTAQRAVESIERGLTTRHVLTARARARTLEILVHSGEIDLVQRALDDMDENLRATNEIRVVQAILRLVQNEPDAAAAALAPILDGASPINPRWEIQACLLKASAEDALGDTGASSRSLERALDLAEPDGLLLPFLLHPRPDLLERHSRLRTAHASLISEILNLLSGHAPAARPEDAAPLQDPLTESELRVLRYLPTNLRGPEIASELFVSPNTIGSHMRNLYAKLGVHTRADAVSRARELGLLSPSSLKR